MSQDNNIDPVVLDRILFLQTVLHIAPDCERLGELSCSNLSEVPGIRGVALYSQSAFVSAHGGQQRLSEAVWNATGSQRERIDISVSVGEAAFGYLTLIVHDNDAFARYKPYIENTARLIALIQDNWQRAHKLEMANLELENQVSLRTAHLESSETRLRTMIEHAPEGIVLIDASLESFLEANSKACEMFGRDREQLLHTGILDLSPEVQPSGEPSAKLAVHYITAAVNGELPVFEWQHLKLDGTPFPCEVRLVRVNTLDSDRILVRGSITDISARRRLEEQLAHSVKMDAVGQLSGGLAHDFNNLLVTILGNAELLAQDIGSNNAEALDMLGDIQKAARRGGELSHRLLAFSKKQTLIPHPVQLDELARGMINLLRRTLGEHVRVEMVHEAKLWTCLADQGQVENSILNLALNARDAMPSGGTLSIQISNQNYSDPIKAKEAGLSPGDYLSLRVSDTGHGIGTENIKRITEPFYTTKESGKGTGLGLSMVYGFARQSSGNLLISSIVGKGSTFDIVLPRLAQGDRAEAPLDSKANQRVPHSQGERILLVEDEPSVRALIQKQLRQLGYHVIAAADANVALDIHSNSPAFQLLLTDVVLSGGQSGPDLASTIKEKDQGIRVLFMSGYAADKIKQIDQGSAFLPKPFSLDELANKLHTTMQANGTATDRLPGN